MKTQIAFQKKENQHVCESGAGEEHSQKMQVGDAKVQKSRTSW